MSIQNAKIFDALGNAIRRQVLSLLSDKSMKVKDIAACLPISRAAVSKHLKIMKDAKLVKSRARGTESIFELEVAGFEAARGWLGAFWDEALTNYKLVAENIKEVT